MRILIHDYSGHPPQVYLSRELAQRGHQVLHLYSAAFETPRGSLDRQPNDPVDFSIAGVDLGEPFHKHTFVRRQLQEIQYGRKLIAAVADFSPDVVVCSNTPLFPLGRLAKWCRRHSVPFVFWVMDVYGIAVHRILRRLLPLVGGLVGLYYIWLEQRLLRASDKVIVISEDFAPLIESWRVDPARIEVMPLWAPIAEIPVLPKDNDWARRHDLAATTNVVYAGTLGFKHNPGMLADLAARCRDRPDVRIVVVSEGRGAAFLAEAKSERGLDNMVLLPFQPFAELPALMASADILVVLLEPDAGVFAVPGKVLSHLCSGRPQVAAIPGANRAARVMNDSGGGLTVEPGDDAGFVAAVERLLDDAELRRGMGRAGRAYAEREFDIERLGARFEAIIATTRQAPGEAAMQPLL